MRRATADLAHDRRDDIQGLRAIAVLLVVAFHAGLPLPGGFVGVDVFFVISGFVIARSLLHELDTTDRLELGAFYARRVRRLLPALALLFVVVAVASGFLLSPLGPQQATAKTGIGASVFAANIQLFRTPTDYFDVDAGANAMLHTWSLSVEEQFYLVFPGCLLVAWRLATWRGRRSRLTIASIVVVATAGSFALSWYTSHGYADRIAHELGGGVFKFAFYMPATRAWELGVGILIALGAPTISKLPRLCSDLCGVVGSILVATASIVITSADQIPGTAALIPVAATALLIVAGTASGSMITSVLKARPMRWIGDVSYGWYLWHWPLIVFARATWPRVVWVSLAAAILALGPTWISYRFVENPLRFSSRIAGRRIIALACGCIGVSVAAGLGLWLVSRVEIRDVSVAELSSAVQRHADEVHGCSGGPRIDQPTDRCTWRVVDPLGTIFLIGDSNAGHFTEAAASAANGERYNLTVATRSACPFVDLEVLVARHDAIACRAFVRETLAVLVRTAPALTIIASASTSYVNSDEVAIRDPRTGDLAYTPEAKARLWEAGLQSVLAPLARAGIPTLIVHTVPQLDGLALTTCPFFKIRDDVKACELTVARIEIDRQQYLAREAERRAVEHDATAFAVDFTNDLCSEQWCSSRRDARWLYRDSGHISVEAAKELSPHLRQLIIQHARPDRGKRP